MKTTINYLCGLAVCLFALVSSATAHSSVAHLPAAERPITARDLVGVNDVYGVQISPDGKWVMYYLSKPDLERNEKRWEWWLVQTTGADKPRLLPSWSGYAWAPDSQTIAFVTPKFDEIRLLRLADMSETVLTKRGDWKAGLDEELEAVGSLQWSPDGKSLAFVVNTNQKKAPIQDAQKVEAWRAVEMDVLEGDPRVSERPVGVLCVLDVVSGGARRLIDGSTGINIVGVGVVGPLVSWSPNNTQLVVTAREIETPGRVASDLGGLYIVDRATGKLKTLFKKVDEAAARPMWSPDGKWIAYNYDSDRRTGSDSKIAVISPESGEQRSLTQNDNEIYNVVSPRFWSRDSKEFYFEVPYKLRFHLFRASLEGKITKVTPDDGNYGDFSISEQGDTVAFLYQNVTEPPEIYVASMLLANRKKLTELNPQLKGVAMPKVETMKWRSGDNKWDIHGILVKPVGYVEGRRYPLMVAVRGGPGAITHSFGIDTRMAVLALAARGYLVLVPSDRGRPGFGFDLHSSLYIGGNYRYGDSLGDVTSGLDELVRRGMADAERVGFIGWSHGANVGVYSLPYTNRFKAAWLGDPTKVDEGLLFHLSRAGRPQADGVPAPLTAERIDRDLKNAPIYHMRNVKTPTLLECGGSGPLLTAYGRAAWPCMLYFQGLRSFKVPSEMHVFEEEGHGWRKPLQWEESFNRQLEWMDYWVRGVATERMAKRYGTPKQAAVTSQ